MKNEHGDGSYYKFKTGKIRFRKMVKIDGQLRTFSKTADDRKLAKKKVNQAIKEAKAEAKLQKDIDAGLTPGLTVAGYLADWWPTVRTNKGQPYTLKSSDRLRSGIENQINPLIGDIKLTDLTSQHIENMVENITKEGKSQSTIRNAYFTLSKALKQAKKKNLITINPMHDTDSPSMDDNPKEAATMTKEELTRLLSIKDADGEVRWSVILKLIATTGMRSGEALGLQWKNIDLETGRVQIRQTSIQVSDLGNIIGKPKTPESLRTITVKAMVPDLNAHLDYVTIMDEKANRLEKEVSSDWVFTGADGQVMVPASLYEALKRRIKTVLDSIDASNIKGKKRWEYLYDEFNVKSLRTTAATLMHLSGEVGDKEIQEILGHTSIATTMKHYVKTNDTKKAEAVDVLSKAIGIGDQKLR